MSEPLWIGETEALVLHDRLLARHGGAAGLRDPGLLRSALARPRQHAAYAGDATAGDAGIVTLAALYTAAIIRNHPFVDGNKRTGFVLGVPFLELNGLAFTASQEDAANAVLALAAGAIDAQGYAAFLAANVAPGGNGGTTTAPPR